MAKHKFVKPEVNEPAPVVDVEPAEVNKPAEPEQPVVSAVAYQMYRYFCDACTGVAFQTSTPEQFATITCDKCGKLQPTKKENWIKM